MKQEPEYNNLIIWYFSGTGNARRAAEWVDNSARVSGLSTRLVNIDRNRQVIIPEMPQGKSLFGFSFPTHGFNLSPIMLHYILKFPRRKGQKVFLMNTRGGMKLSKRFLPGISGIALLLPAIILLLKGYRIVALKPVDLPSNWISLHPGLKPSVSASIHDRWKIKLHDFGLKLIQGKKMYPAFWSIIIDLLLVPIAIGYYFIGRFMLAKTFIATKDCTACNVCVERCPTESIAMVGDLPYWKYTCESCMRCMNACPHRAIETTHSISIALWYMVWTVLPLLAWRWINALEIINIENKGWLYKIIDLVISIGITFSMIYIAYRLLHYGLKYNWVNRLVKLTSFTSYRFWRRYKVSRGI